jgi:exopolyphosphatase/pppGpp-phosphohydrolase
MILRGVMGTIGIEEIRVSVRGLRYGVALEAGGNTSQTTVTEAPRM